MRTVSLVLPSVISFAADEDAVSPSTIEFAWDAVVVKPIETASAALAVAI